VKTNTASFVFLTSTLLRLISGLDIKSLFHFRSAKKFFRRPFVYLPQRNNIVYCSKVLMLTGTCRRASIYIQYIINIYSTYSTSSIYVDAHQNIQYMHLYGSYKPGWVGLKFLKMFQADFGPAYKIFRNDRCFYRQLLLKQLF